MKDRMFVVPGGFVPYNDTVTLVSYKRLRNLDMDIDVFCFRGKEDPGIAKELEKDEQFRKFNIKYTTDYDWAIPRNYPIRLPFGLFFMNKYVTDSLKEFEKKDYKYLYSTIAPGIPHIAANYIKKKHPEVKWIAAFTDPFRNSPYKFEDLSKKSIFYKIAFNVGSYCLYNDRYEEVAVNNADKLVFICEEQRDFTLKQYPNYEELLKKTVIYPLTYIPEWQMYKNLLDTKRVIHDGPKQAVHLGRLYGLRKIDEFLEALRELKAEDNVLEKKIVFHQYSEIQASEVKKIEEYGLKGVFKLHDKVTYNESVNTMKEADVLVLFDTLMPEKPIQPFLPSKITEYLMLKKPILAVCAPNSPSYRILKEYGYDTVGYKKEEIKNNIKAIIDEDKHYDYSLEKINNDNYDKLLID